MVCGDVLVGVDVGTFGTKAVVVDLEGRILGDSFKETDIMSPKPLWAEQWPQVWFRALCDAVKVAVSRAGVDSSDVVGLCVSGLYSGSGIPCDRRMEPIRPCIIWMDRRAVREVEWVRRNIGEERVTDEMLIGALNFIVTYALIDFTLAVALSWVSGTTFVDALFETTSAMSCVGLSIGLASANLVLPGKIILILGMYLGRIEFIQLYVISATLLKRKTGLSI